MAEAGWCFNLNDEDEDSAQCFYCDLVLSGWEPKDDPRYVAAYTTI
jgi:baculoviral IAP repeat-containing protein 5